jgi:ribosomal protein S18 acetylase RimI-like enzyme
MMILRGRSCSGNELTASPLEGFVVIRPTVPADTPLLLALTEGTGVFKPHEVETLREVLDDYHSFNHAHDHVCVTDERDGQVVGYAYYAPDSMTDRTWYLYWIAVQRTTQARGVGSDLLRYAEADIRQRHGRLFLIETSSQPSYEPTRRFYAKHGYEIGAVLRDFYTDGDDMVIFSKRLGD